MSEPINGDVWVIQNALYAARNARDGLLTRQMDDALLALDRLARSRRNAIGTAHRLRRAIDAAQRGECVESPTQG